MMSAQEEVKKTSTLEALPTLNDKTSMITFNIQNLLKLNVWQTLKLSYHLLTCSKSCIASWIATESDKMIEIKAKDTLGL